MSEFNKIQNSDIAESYKRGWTLAVGRCEELYSPVIQNVFFDPKSYGMPNKGADHKGKVKNITDQ
jgi:hypothetical protein